MDKKILECVKTLENVQAKSPLVHSITNLVVTNTTANILLAVGASPLMSHAPEELEEIVGISQALVINIGTLDMPQINSMKLAMQYAKEKNVPCVLDPVGAGASALRTNTAQELISLGKPAIIRGNSSEILALAQVQNSTSRGVDASDSVKSAEKIAQELAKEHKCTISVSGESDYVTDGVYSAEISTKEKGKLPLSLITKITGMGCSCTAITGACLAVQPDSFIAGVTAMAIMKAANSVAIQKAEGPASLQLALIDALYTLKPEDIQEYIDFKECR